MKKIVIAPDSFKGSLTAKEVADCIEKGINKIVDNVEIVKVPIADGGEGTVQSLVDATDGKIINLKVHGPLCKKVDSFYGILGDKETAIIEMAAASGLTLIPENKRNPLKTTTYGTGELIKHALSMKCKNVIIGIGGSATNDGGAGALAALGVKFLDKNDKEIGLGGENLINLHHIDTQGLDKRLKDKRIIIACDVNNPLCGPKGASAVFGPQKGANEKMVKLLDKSLLHYANIIKRDLGIDIKDVPGAGAAGGLGGGLLAFLNAKLKRGIDIVIEVTDLGNKIKDADLVFTGEGMIDYQTVYGKTPYGVAKTAEKFDVPVIAIAGSIGKGEETLYEHGFAGVFSIVDRPLNLEDAIANAASLVEKTTQRIMRIIRLNCS